MKRMQNQTMPVKKQTWRDKVTYVKKNWQLYLFFLMPGLLLTIIFKYLPMGGLLIAFEDYNVIKGVLGSPWVGLEYFRRFLSSPDFMNYLLNTLKLSIYGLLWGFPVPIILALLLNRIRRNGVKKKVQLLVYMPNFISVIVLCGMVRMLLSPVGPLNKYKLDDNAVCFPHHLHSKWNLADSRLGLYYVHGCFIKCKQRTGRSSYYGWRKSSAADLVCRASCNQEYYCNSVYPAGWKYYEYWI